MKPLHPAVQAHAGAATAVAKPDLASRRADYARFAAEVGGDPEPVPEIRDIEIPGPAGPLRARWYRPDAPQPGVLVYFHGGGWSLGDLDGIDRVCRSLCNAGAVAVLSVDYRLAPEHPFPAAVDDAEASVRWIATAGADDVGADGSRLAVGGDSAGANLAAVVARRARDAGDLTLRRQVLVYPVTDLRMRTGSYSEPQADGLLDRAEMEAFRTAYLGGADPTDPDVSPLCAADLAGLAPAFVAVAGHDVLRDEGVAYAERLRAEGVPVTLVQYEDMAHGFIRWGGVLDAARDLHRSIGATVRDALAG